LNDNIYFLVTDLYFTIVIDQLDPVVQYFWPFILTNPWSAGNPTQTEFRMYSKFVSQNLTYACSISYQHYQLVCSVEVLYVITEQWWGNCLCPKPSNHTELTPSNLISSTVNLYPLFSPNFYFKTTSAEYLIYEQVVITGIVPEYCGPNQLVQINAVELFYLRLLQLRFKMIKIITGIIIF